jgi:hypothetical protein
MHYMHTLDDQHELWPVLRLWPRVAAAMRHMLFRAQLVKIKTAELELVVYIPKEIANGQIQTSYDVHVFYHGGGMVRQHHFLCTK